MPADDYTHAVFASPHFENKQTHDANRELFVEQCLASLYQRYRNGETLNRLCSEINVSVPYVTKYLVKRYGPNWKKPKSSKRISSQFNMKNTG